MKNFLTSYKSIVLSLVLTFSASVGGCGVLPNIFTASRATQQITEKKTPSNPPASPLVPELRPIAQSARSLPYGNLILDVVSLLAGGIGSAAAATLKQQQSQNHAAIRELSSKLPTGTAESSLTPNTQRRLAAAKAEA